MYLTRETAAVLTSTYQRSQVEDAPEHQRDLRDTPLAVIIVHCHGLAKVTACLSHLSSGKVISAPRICAGRIHRVVCNIIAGPPHCQQFSYTQTRGPQPMNSGVFFRGIAFGLQNYYYLIQRRRAEKKERPLKSVGGER